MALLAVALVRLPLQSSHLGKDSEVPMKRSTRLVQLVWFSILESAWAIGAGAAAVAWQTARASNSVLGLTHRLSG